MKSTEIREKFLNFFKERQHHILDSASVVTDDNKGITNPTLFNNAGVQPIIPYILKGNHPDGVRLASAQKCIRTIDIEEVGDNTHLTFFEMLGNWSIGDYFKEQAINWSYEFLTSKKTGLGLDPERIYITVFAGNSDAEKDTESFNIWKKLLPENRIFYLESNWWAAGENGPCGPDTEIFYDTTDVGLGNISFDEFTEADESQDIVEIWNNVFMQYEKENNIVIGKLKTFAVDTGAGLERMTTILNKKSSVFDTDVFLDAINLIKENSVNFNLKSARIIADHIRTAVVMISDGVLPANTDRGYILRRLIRRAVKHFDKIDLDTNKTNDLIEIINNNLGQANSAHKSYPQISENIDLIKSEIEKEVNKFQKTLINARKEFIKIIEKNKTITEEEAFKLFSSHGMPLEFILELADDYNINVNKESFENEFKKHQDLSRKSSGDKFKGGLAGNSEIEKRYHTATHLLHQALFDILGDHIEQKGSNINTDRMRFDFSHPEKISPEVLDKIEELVNEKIKASLPVQMIELNKDEAIKTGARHLFSDKYGDTVSVYYIGHDLDSAYSKEFCGGPHVKNTDEIGEFKIKKEESVAQGIRRIKAVIR